MIFQKSIAAFRLILKKMKEAAQNFRKAVKKVNVIVGQNPSGDGSKSL